MLKRLFRIGMIACVLTFACNSYAQDGKGKYDYPRYGMWSNWSFGALAGPAWQSGLNANVANPTGGWAWGAKAIAKKQLNWDWTLRATVGAPMMWARFGGIDGFVSTVVGVEYSILNSCNWNPDRKADFYAFIESGLSWKAGNSQAAHIAGGAHFGLNALYTDMGLGYSYDLTEHSTVMAEASYGINADVPAPNANHQFTSQSNVLLGIGYLYRTGLTAVDVEIQNQKSQLTLDNLDALTKQINDLELQVRNNKKAEEKLNNQIADLEQQLRNRPNVTGGNGNNANNDSLQAIINQIKDDQLTFYALPFSVLYPVDVWKIPADQMEKVKACARVMKDNPNVKFNLVGFCDMTGSDDYNWKLSQRRAEEVKRVLVEQFGIPADRLTCDWKGKTMAFGDLNYSVNRRTSFYRVIE